MPNCLGKSALSKNYGVTCLFALQEQEIRPAKKKPAVEAEAQSRLRTSNYLELRRVSCEFHEGVLTLRGRVPTFYLKQIAQELIRQLDGVVEINNRLVVAAPPGLP